MERVSLGRRTFPLKESNAADEGLFALDRESVEKGTFPLNELRAAEEEHFALKRERALKRDLSAERIIGS